MFEKEVHFAGLLIDIAEEHCQSLRYRGTVVDFELGRFFSAMAYGIQEAWIAIAGLLPEIRNQSIDPKSFKDGSDFFTKADLASEKVIRETFEPFGAAVRIFGEEEGRYLGNSAARISVRIDPIDGTRTMKFSRFKWSIMAGVYSRLAVEAEETQIMSMCYFPELTGQPVLFHVRGDDDWGGTYVVKTDFWEKLQVQQFPERNDLGNIITTFWKHTDFRQRGAVQEIENEIACAGGHAVSTDAGSCDVLEAALTAGQRAMIIDGDYNLVDFIPHPAITTLGYKIYRWDGTLMRPEDPALVNQKLVVVPPGKAGEQILKIVGRYATSGS